jgi:copper chaperone CopZ
MAEPRREATSVLKVKGMDDSGRAMRLRQAADKIDGIFQVDIDYILDSVTVRYDADKLTHAQVKRKLGIDERRR